MPRNTIKSIRLYRGTTQQHSDYAGPVGEITVDTEKYTVVVQNGVTGGVPLARESDVTAEAQAREAADTALQNDIASEASSRATADTAIQKSITDEVSARKAADTALQKSITDEASARETADNAFQKQIDDALRRGAIIGEVRWFAMSTPPEGWLVCNGASVGTSDYPALFAAIGNTFLPKDYPEESGFFFLPDLMGKVPWGSSQVGTEMKAGLPNITGGFGLRPVDGGMNVTWETNNKAFKVTTIADDSSRCVARSSSQGSRMNVTIDASRSSSVYGNSTTVQPPALCLLPCIRYE